MSFDFIDQELWHLYLYSPLAVQGPVTQTISLRCYEFNYKGQSNISVCQYKHDCILCSLSHRYIKCRHGSSFDSTCRPISVSTFSRPQLPRMQSTLATFARSALLQHPRASKQPTNINLSSIAHSPINVLNLSKYLFHYPDRIAAFEFCFTYGFKLGNQGPRVVSGAKNLKSLYCLQRDSIQAVNKEILLVRVAGLFMHSPLPNLRLSPVGMVPKTMGHFDSFTTYPTHLDLVLMVIPLAEDKALGPTNCLVYFGLEINISSMIVPLDKVEQLKSRCYICYKKAKFFY